MVLYAEGPRFKSPVCTKELSAGIVFLGGWGWSYWGRKEISHNILEYVKFPTNRTFHGNFPISAWENFSGNLTCMLEWNCYLTSIHGNHTFHLRQCGCNQVFNQLKLLSPFLSFQVSRDDISVLQRFAEMPSGFFSKTLQRWCPGLEKEALLSFWFQLVETPSFKSGCKLNHTCSQHSPHRRTIS